MALMDAIELLKHDHRMVEQLFRDYDAAASDQQKRGVVEIAHPRAVQARRAGGAGRSPRPGQGHSADPTAPARTGRAAGAGIGGPGRDDL